MTLVGREIVNITIGIINTMDNKKLNVIACIII